MTTWGVSAQGHDAAIAVFHHSNELVFAAHAERYSRVKNDSDLNKAIIHEALRFGEPEKIVWYEDPGLKWVRRAFTNSFSKPEVSPAKYIKQFYKAPRIKKALRSNYMKRLLLTIINNSHPLNLSSPLFFFLGGYLPSSYFPNE